MYQDTYKNALTDSVGEAKREKIFPASINEKNVLISSHVKKGQRNSSHPSLKSSAKISSKQSNTKLISKSKSSSSSLKKTKEERTTKKETSSSQEGLLRKYFREVRRYPLLSKEQEHELAVLLQKQEGHNTAYRLITANLRLVVKIAKEYQSSVANVMDLIQEGNVGLIKAVSKYDPHKGVRLATYAQWWIRAYILKFLVNNARLVKVGTTQAQRKLFFSLNKEKNRLKAAGFKPDSSVLAKNLGVGLKDVKEMEKRLARPDLSMDLNVGDEQKQTVGDLMASQIPDAETDLIDNDLGFKVRNHLKAFSKTLKKREKVLWEKRLLSDERMTLREIGDMFGLTRERARQIEKSMLIRLREYLQQELPELEESDLIANLQSKSSSPFDLSASYGA